MSEPLKVAALLPLLGLSILSRLNGASVGATVWFVAVTAFWTFVLWTKPMRALYFTRNTIELRQDRASMGHGSESPLESAVCGQPDSIRTKEFWAFSLTS